VYVVDDDTVLLGALVRLLEPSGYRVVTFPSPVAFLEQARPEAPCCLLLDVHMPGLSGLELQEVLARGQEVASIVFMSGQADVPTSVKAMKAGAVDFLAKPFTKEQLLQAIAVGLRRSAEREAVRARSAGVRERLARLTPREREVCERVALGMKNREIAVELGTALKTIKVHRGRAMEKLGVASVAELVLLLRRTSG